MADIDDEPLEPFEIRRRGRLYAAIALVSLLLAGGYAYWAYDRGPAWLWVFPVVFVGVAVFYGRALVDSRTPLFVADQHGIRLRTRKEWTGILWAETGEVLIERRQGIFADPRVKIVASDGLQIFTSPVGIATTASLGTAEVELARRRGVAPS
ncbi:hypothetical protein BH09ACT10_BH09ACT10_07070 [soil metagenome]